MYKVIAIAAATLFLTGCGLQANTKPASAVQKDTVLVEQTVPSSDMDGKSFFETLQLDTRRYVLLSTIVKDNGQVDRRIIGSFNDRAACTRMGMQYDTTVKNMRWKNVFSTCIDRLEEVK